MAQPFYDRAETTHTALIDRDHTVSALYNLVNVPTGIMIDEEGRIVRMDEGTYSKKYEAGNLSFGTDEYVPMVRDWAEKGAASEFVRSRAEMTEELATWKRSQEQTLADANFRLGVHLFKAGQEERAEQYWRTAQELHPESWNYHRQDWSFDGQAAAGQRWFEKFQELEGKPYYRPLKP